MATNHAVPNHIGLPILDYRGAKTTLCPGCGHNAISERIIDAMFEMGVEPERVALAYAIDPPWRSRRVRMSSSASRSSASAAAKLRW